MEEQPLVSIIIPTYNRAHLIGETLDSVLAQTYQNWECIIVDDGSSDNTDEVVGEYVKKDARFKYYHRPDEHLPGGNGARNYGFKMSKGEYIQWFDSDDLMLPEKLQLCVIEVIKDESLDLVITNYKQTDGKVNIINDNNEKDILKYHLGLGGLNTVMIFFKRNFITDFSFDEKLFRAQEYEFFIRVLKQKNTYCVINEITVIVRIHKNSISSNYQKAEATKYLKSMLYVMLKGFKESKIYGEDFTNLAKVRFLKPLILAAKNKRTGIFLIFFLKYSFHKKISLSQKFKILMFYTTFFFTSNSYYKLKKEISNA